MRIEIFHVGDVHHLIWPFDKRTVDCRSRKDLIPTGATAKHALVKVTDVTGK